MGLLPHLFQSSAGGPLSTDHAAPRGVDFPFRDAVDLIAQGLAALQRLPSQTARIVNLHIDRWSAGRQLVDLYLWHQQRPSCRDQPGILYQSVIECCLGSGLSTRTAETHAVVPGRVGCLGCTLSHPAVRLTALDRPGLSILFWYVWLDQKIAPLGALHSLSLETGIIFIPALLYLLYAESQGNGSFGHLGWNATLLLAFAGVVTALPLLLFGLAARSIPLTMLGILQYIAPTVQFLLGIFLYQEPFTVTRLVGFSIIWLALLIFTVEGLYERRKRIASAPIV